MYEGLRVAPHFPQRLTIVWRMHTTSNDHFVYINGDAGRSRPTLVDHYVQDKGDMERPLSTFVN